MAEDIGTILNKGFNTWTRNLNICIPFVLNFIISALLVAVAFLIFVGVLILPELTSTGLDPATISPEQMMDIFSSVFTGHPWIIIAGVILIIPVMMFVQAYFTAGAIGMSKRAAETGNTTLKEMWRSANQNAVNLFFTNILISLISLAGIVFIVPGALVTRDFSMLLTDPTQASGSILLLVTGFLIWMLYILAVHIMLSVAEYALVVDNLDPISALETGFKFFINNKFDVFSLWLIMIALSFFITIIGEMMNSVQLLATVWTFADLVISIVIIPPLTTIWWTRLWLDRTGRKLYDHGELLTYP